MTQTAQKRLRLVPKASQSETTPEQTAPAFDDSVILARLHEGDPAISAAFYDRVRPIVDRTLSRLLGKRDNDYEDVAQIALFELVETLDRFRGECPLDAWLSIVTARVVYRQLRRRRLERRFFSNTELSEVGDNVRSMPVAFASRQAVHRVHEHLSAMDDNRSWTFLLHDAWGYGLKEIADIMGCSASAAQSRLVRGRRELHDRIAQDPELAHFLDDIGEDVP